MHIANIERMIAEQTPILAKEAPEQLRDMKTLVRELKTGKSPTITSQQMMRSLVIWQLDAKREAYSHQLESLENRVGNTLARRALQDMIRVLDEGKSAMTTPSAQAMRAVELASSRAKASLEEAEASQKAAVHSNASTIGRGASQIVSALEVAHAQPTHEAAKSASAATTQHDPDATPPRRPAPAAKVAPAKPFAKK